MKKIIEFLVHRSLLGNILTVGIIFLGLIALSNMRREVFPSISLDILNITVIYPGASPQEVEKLITIPIERELKSLDGIKKANSTSIESRSGISVTLDPDTKNKEKVIQDIKDAVDRAKVDFPKDSEEPSFIEINSDRQGVIEIGLGSKKNILNEYQLREYATQLADRIEILKDTALVNKRGYREREIHVEIFPDKLEFYDISAEEIVNALKNRNLNLPGGNIKDKSGMEYSIRTEKEFQNKSEIENLIVRANDLGGAIKIADIASVRDDFEDKEVLEKVNGKEAIILTILKKKTGDAIDLVDEIMVTLDDFRKSAHTDLEITTFNDFSFYVKRRLNVLINNIAIGLLLVAIVLIFFLGWRVALMVAIGLPFAFAITFLIMEGSDLSINLISMFGLIIAVGLVVDDAIIIGENIYRHIQNGMPPIKAAIQGTQEMINPVFAAITTTCIAFLPLVFMPGIMGKFVWILPTAVIISLAASLIESFFILPVHISDISKKKLKKETMVEEKKSWIANFSDNISKLEKRLFQFLQNIYKPVLVKAVRYRYLTIIFASALFILGIVLIGRTGFILFPADGVEIVIAKIEAKTGVSLEEMNDRIHSIEKGIHDLDKDELDNYNTRIGIHQNDPNDPFTKRGKNYAQINIYLTPEQERNRNAAEIIGYLKQKVDPENPIYNIAKTKKFKKYGDIYQIKNSPYIEFLSASSNYKNTKKIKIAKEFLLGGMILPGKNVFIGYTGNNKVILFDLKKNKLIRSKDILLKRYDAPAKFIAEPNGNFGLLVTKDGHLYKLNIESLEKEHLKSYNEIITSVYLNPTKKNLLVSTNGGLLEIWKYNKDDISLEKKISYGPRYFAKQKIFHSEKKFPLGRIENIILDPKNDLILVSSFKGFIRLYDIRKEKFVENYKLSERPILWSMLDVWDPSLIWFCTEENLFIFDRKKKKIIQSQQIVGRVQNFMHIPEDRSVLLFGTYGMLLSTSPLISKNVREINILRSDKRLFKSMELAQARGGPPVGAPVQIEIRGDDFSKSLEIAEYIKDISKSIDGVYDVKDNWERGKKEFHVEIDEVKASIAAVSVSQIASSLQTAFEGSIATSIKKADEEIDIRVIFPEELRKRIASLKEVKVRNSIGSLVPITELATFTEHPGVPLISHTDYRRTIYVQANINEKQTSSIKVNTEINERLEPIIKKYPGYDVLSGGEYEDTQESLDSLRFSGLVALLGIGIILVLLFGNLRSPRVIMSAIPLCIIGVAIAFFIHKQTIWPTLVFSFLATMGIIGLTGVVVNDSIVLIDFITKQRNKGIDKMNAIINGCMLRLRAVFLTTITTVFGLLPTAYGIGGDDPFLRPMALALAWGLAFASLITLVITPAYYSVWEDRGFIFHNIKRKLSGTTLEIEKK